MYLHVNLSKSDCISGSDLIVIGLFTWDIIIRLGLDFGLTYLCILSELLKRALCPSYRFIAIYLVL